MLLQSSILFFEVCFSWSKVFGAWLLKSCCYQNHRDYPHGHLVNEGHRYYLRFCQKQSSYYGHLNSPFYLNSKKGCYTMRHYVYFLNVYPRQNIKENVLISIFFSLLLEMCSQFFSWKKINLIVWSLFICSHSELYHP